MIDREKVVQVIEKLGLSGGIFVDLGCGIGSGTESWSESVDMTVIGIDRQKFDPWYERWFSESNGTNFLVGDFGQGIPLPADSVDIALLEFVIQHITTVGIEKMLIEVLRVIKANGILVIGPQHEDWEDDREHNDEQWRFFRKTTNSRGEAFFQRVRLEQLLA